MGESIEEGSEHTTSYTQGNVTTFSCRQPQAPATVARGCCGLRRGGKTGGGCSCLGRLCCWS